jgi:hypothetical protein
MRPASRIVTLFGHQAREQAWRVERAGSSFAISEVAGRLTAGNGYEQRLTLRYDGGAPGEEPVLSCGGRTIPIPIHVLPAIDADLPVEDQRTVAIPVAAAPASSAARAPACARGSISHRSMPPGRERCHRSIIASPPARCGTDGCASSCCRPTPSRHRPGCG